MHVFYVPAEQEGHVVLSEEESKHCIRVLRLQQGDKVLITNGNGQLFDALIADPHPKRTSLILSNGRLGYDHWPYYIHIAIAPTKQLERLEWFLEKAVEIGVDEISLFTSFHSERRALNIERLQKVMIAAMKQSLKSRLPLLNPITTFNQLITSNFEGQKCIAWIDESVNELLSTHYVPGSRMMVLIGPEGDFSPEEVVLSQNNGFVPVNLGNARLRTETAALMACHTIQLINELQSSDSKHVG